MFSGTSKGFGLDNVIFSSGFFSSPYANDKVLDFVINLRFRATTSTTFTQSSFCVVHGYTIWSQKASAMKASMVNWYNQ